MLEPKIFLFLYQSLYILAEDTDALEVFATLRNSTDYGASNTGANEESLRMVSSQPIGN